MPPARGTARSNRRASLSDLRTAIPDILGAAGFHPALQIAADHARAMLGAHHAALWWRRAHEDGPDVIVRTCSGRCGLQRCDRRPPLDDEVWRSAHRSGTPARAARYASRRRRSATPGRSGAATEAQGEWLAGAIVCSAGEALLCVSDPRGRSFTRADERRLRDLTGLVAPVIERQRASAAFARRTAELVRAETRLRQLWQAVPDGILVVDHAGEVQLANAQACQLLGYEPPEMLGLPLERLVPPARRDAHARQRTAFTAAPRRRAMGPGRRFEALRKDGSAVPVEISLSPVMVEGSAAVIAAIRDVSDKVEAETVARASEARYESLYHEAPDMLVSIDPATQRVAQCNRTFATRLGARSDALIGTPLADLVVGGSRPAALDALAAAAAGRAVRDVELELPPVGGGAPVAAALNALLVADEQGREFVRCVLRDITERKRTEREIALLESQVRGAQRLETVGRLAAGIAHDFNNVLCVIQGYATFLQEEAPDDRTRADVQAILDGAERASKLTQQLLAFGRRQIQRLEVISVDTLVEEFLTMLTPILGEDVELLTRPGGHHLTVRADAGQLEQVLMNLVVNARDAMPAGGRITIETRAADLDDEFARTHPGATTGPHVVIEVRDTGVGMDERTRAQIFEPFFTTKPVGKGTGLGLATVYGIVKQSGGSIWVESEVGTGTGFQVCLPRVSGVLPKAVVRPAPPPTLGGSERVLIVDNDPAVRRLVRRLLERNGYQVLEAGGAEEAERVWAARGDAVDLVVTDVVMPGTSGVELASRLRSSRPTQPLLFLSAFPGDARVAGLLSRGEPLLPKPFSAKALLGKVRETLDAPSPAASGEAAGGEG